MLLGNRFTALNGVAVLIGALAGLAAVLLRWAIDYIENASFSGTFDFQEATSREVNQYIEPMWGLLVVLVPLGGGLVVGLIRWVWPQILQHGVTEVMAAVQAKGGILRGRSAVGHGLMSAITVGTGGSTGREGPIGYIGAAVGSSLGRQLHFTARDIKVLLGCGFAAGIAATFNAPMGGVLMAMELVVPEFSTHAFIPIVIAAVIGVTVAHFFLNGEATFQVPGFALNDVRELFIFFALGILCGLVAVAFIRTLAWSSQAWARMRLHSALKPALGGLLVGAIGLTMLLALPIGEYHVFGTGYATVSDILTRSPAGFDLALLATIGVLLIAKPVATTLTVGSGGGGGVMSVSLYQGALLGGLVGFAAHQLWPTVAVDPAGYALVGMGAFYAASSRATLTAIIFLAELTQNFAILIPVMLAAVTADGVAVRFSRDTLYTIGLTRRGIRYEYDRLTSPLDFLLVRDVMTTKVDVLPATMTVGDAFNRMLDLGHTGYPVVDADGLLSGIVTRRDISKHMQAGRGGEPRGAGVPGLGITAFPEEALYKARDRIHQQGIGRLVVVEPGNRRKVLGVVTRSDLLRAEAERDVEHEEEWSQ